MTSQSYDTFISYQSNDVKLAEDLYHRLTAQGFHVWFDKKRLKHGFNWHKEIEEGCEASRVVLTVLTPRWKTSEWTKFETYGAEAVIPLHYEGVWDKIATPPLMRYQNGVFDCNDLEKADWPKLFQSIRELLSRPAPQKDKRIIGLRYRANPHFVGREVELNKIHEALYRKPTAALTQGPVQAIAAMGGIGKTTLAREYAEKFWRLYPQIFWVDVGHDLETEFASIADLLDPHLKNLTDIKEKARIALQILNDRTERLLILDNAEDEKSVHDWIPKSGSCHTIITSRFTVWSAGIETCYIYVLDPGPARQLLLLRAGREASTANNDVCNRLAEKLGWLPLALEQAAAYIHQQGIDYGFEDYLRLYDEASHELLDEGVLGSTEYPDSVITTWKATIVKLSVSARALLRLSAFLSTEPVPIEMFVKGADTVMDRADELNGHGDKAKTSKESYIRKAIKNLSNYSMITSHGKDFSVHSLVQTVERLDTPETKQAQWIEKAAETVVIYGPENAHEPKTWPIWNRLQSHAEQLWEYTHGDNRVEPNIKLLSELAKLYFGKGMYYESIPLGQRIVDIMEENLGSDHIDLAYYLGNLGESLKMVNRLEEAAEYFRQALGITTKHYGTNHQETASDMNYLALALEGLNKRVEAERLYRSALDVYDNVEDPDQHALAKCLNNLAGLLKDNSDYDEAESLYRRSLEIIEKVLGPDHPHTAFSLNNLAGLLRNKGDHEGAESLCRRALDISEKALGPDHPNTAIIFHELAFLLDKKGEYSESVTFYKQALGIWQKAYDNDHTLVINCKLNMQICLHHATNKDFDLNELKSCTRLLRERNDPLAEKGLTVLKEFEEGGFDSNSFNTDGITPLKMASQKGHANVVDLLLDAKTDVNKDRYNVPGGKVDKVHFSVTSSPIVTPGASFILDLWAHLERQRETVIQRAQEAACSNEIKIQSQGPVKVSRGTILSVYIEIKGFNVEDPKSTILWEGEIGNARFLITVPKDAQDGHRHGIVHICVNGLRIAKLYFQIQVGNETMTVASLPIKAERCQKAFASYASEDRDDVLARIQGIQKASPKLKVFFDVISLRSGQAWEQELWKEIPTNDIFYLFWSVNAIESKWVEKEWRCALKTKGIDFIDPVPLVSPNDAPPPPELASKHFNDWVFPYMRSKQA